MFNIKPVVLQSGSVCLLGQCKGIFTAWIDMKLSRVELSV